MKLESLHAELNKVERRRAQLEQQIKAQAEALYTSLPRKVGLKSVDALVLALAPYASPAIRQKLQMKAEAPAKASPAGVASPKGPPPRTASANATRAVDKARRHSDEKKAAIRRALQEEKLTIRAISIKHGIPIDTLKKWKRKWGLTSPTRSKK